MPTFFSRSWPLLATFGGLALARTLWQRRHRIDAERGQFVTQGEKS